LIVDRIQKKNGKKPRKLKNLAEVVDPLPLKGYKSHDFTQMMNLASELAAENKLG